MRIDRRLLTLAFGGLFWRTFLLIALLIAVSLAAWFQSFRVIEREPRAQRVALQLVANVKLTRTARRFTLHLPARWPWQQAFIEALTRIRALPAAA